jgi:MFS family permease
MNSDATPDPRFGMFSLFRRPWAGATILLGAGVGLEALEFYVTASLIPSMVRDIGGLHLLAWTTSIFVVAIVLGGVAIVIRPRGINLRQAYMAGALIFAVGCLIVGLAPTMEVVLAGRFVQGFGAGLLVTLAYSFIRFVYPEGMQNAASAFYSALWGASTLLGPTLGGFFGHDGQWRWAFYILIPIAILMALLAVRLLPEGEDERAPQSVPFAQIVLVISGTLAMSLAGTVETMLARISLTLGGFAALAAVLAVERRGRSTLLPRQATAFGHPLAYTYLAMFLLIVTLNSDIFVPYLLQTLRATTPLVSGYVVALVASGWAVAGMVTASWTDRPARIAIAAGPAVLFATTFALAFVISVPDPGAGLVSLLPVGALLFGMGIGIGLGWAHLISLVITLSKGPEADKATAAINLVPSVAAAFGAAFAGVIANAAGLVTPGGIEGASSAGFWLYALISLSAVLAFLSVLPLARLATAKE